MFLCPIQGEPVVTQKFGERPDYYKKYALKGHNGLDLHSPIGTELHAAVDGVVVVQDQGNKGYGLCVRIKNKSYECVFGHLSKVNVQSGQEVKMGDPIGLSGNSGDSSGPHLHFGVRRLAPDGSVYSAGNGYSGYVDQLPYVIVWSRALNKSKA